MSVMWLRGEKRERAARIFTAQHFPRKCNVPSPKGSSLSKTYSHSSTRFNVSSDSFRKASKVQDKGGESGEKSEKEKGGLNLMRSEMCERQGVEDGGDVGRSPAYSREDSAISGSLYQLYQPHSPCEEVSEGLFSDGQNQTIHVGASRYNS